MTVRKWGVEQVIAGAVPTTLNMLDVCVLKDGSFVVAWVDGTTANYTVMAQHFDDTGKALGASFEIGDGATASGSMLRCRLAALEDGGFAVALNTSDNSSDSWYQRFDATMTPAELTQWDTFNTSKAENDGDVAATKDGGFLLVERDDNTGNGEIWLQKRDADGAVVKFGASTFLNITAGDVGTQYSPHVIELTSGNFVVSWADTGDFYNYRVYGANGTPVSTIRKLTDGVGYGADLTALEGGGFVALRSYPTVTGDNTWGVTAQVFDASGNATSFEFRVNTTTTSFQGRQAVTALPNGGFAVTWDDQSDGDRDITGQIFDATGKMVGTEFRVNTTDDGSDHESRIAALQDGRIVVTWIDSANAAVRYQIIDPRDGVVTGTDGAEILRGHDVLSDEINAKGGNDSVFGLAGNDQIFGGDGDDAVNGGDGDDVVFGGTGNDKIAGGLGNDQLNGEDGADVLKGQGGNDRLNGGDGDDLLQGGIGGDAHDGGAGIDTASYAMAGKGVTVSLDASLIYTGEAAGDTFKAVENLTGSRFADTLRGNAGVNAVAGGGGADLIEGAGGHDTLTGGGGNDTFSFRAVTEAGDTITDFSNAAGNDDHFAFRGAGFGNLAAGTLDETRFQSSADDQAATTSVRFIFETDTGNLYFDRDGSGTNHANVLIATLQAGATVDSGDIVIF